MDILLHPLFLNIPILVSLIAIFRYVIGLRTWKIIPPLFLMFTLYLFYRISNENLWLTIVSWLVSIFIILGPADLLYLQLRKIKMHFYSRISLIYVGTFLGLTINLAVLNEIFGLALTEQLIWATLMIALLTRYLMELQYKKEGIESFRRILFTLLISLIGGLLLIWPEWNDLLLNKPIIVVGVIFVDILVASTSSLKLTELIRFKQILGNARDT